LQLWKLDFEKSVLFYGFIIKKQTNKRTNEQTNKRTKRFNIIILCGNFKSLKSGTKKIRRNLG